jgi:SAM-dependent methyltransferase
MSMSLNSSNIIERWPDVVESFPDIVPSYDAMNSNIRSMRENTKLYYGWIADAITPWLGKRTMEVGAGPGFLTHHMSGFDYYLVTETWEPFLAELRQLTADRRGVEVKSFDVANLVAESDYLRTLRLDSIFSTNMLEHIKDDVAVLRDMASAVSPGGRVVNLVPAYRYLYGEADRVIGHYRRYERDELRAKMEAAGIIVEKIFTFNQAGVFSWMIINKVMRRQSATGDQYALFDRMIPLFRVWERFLPIPVGLSLIGVGRAR